MPSDVSHESADEPMRLSPEASEVMIFEQDGHVATLRLNRPDVLNRFDADLHREFAIVLGHLRARQDIRALVLASTGKVFSSGGDFELMRRMHDDLPFALRTMDEGRQIVANLLDINYPVIAAVQGDVIGLGATVVLGCDAVVACKGARIADPHVNVGLVAGDGGCVVWPQAAGMLRAKRHLLTGDPIKAEDAWLWGLVTDLVEESADVEPAARALAERIAALPPVAVQGTKRSLNRVMQQRAGEVVDLSILHSIVAVGTDDLMEGTAAMKERRQGRFTGR
jgi:enoyl-CoA hydratase